MDASFDIRRRLWNWGTWARSGNDGPDGSCINSIYSMGGAWDPKDEGYGVVDGNTVMVVQLEPARAELDIDEYDAECLDTIIRQIDRYLIAALNKRYVLRVRGWSRADIATAIRAICEAGDATKRVHDYMRGKV